MSQSQRSVAQSTSEASEGAPPAAIRRRQSHCGRTRSYKQRDQTLASCWKVGKVHLAAKLFSYRMAAAGILEGTDALVQTFSAPRCTAGCKLACSRPSRRFLAVLFEGSRSIRRESRHQHRTGGIVRARPALGVAPVGQESEGPRYSGARVTSRCCCALVELHEVSGSQPSINLCPQPVSRPDATPAAQF